MSRRFDAEFLCQAVMDADMDEVNRILSSKKLPVDEPETRSGELKTALYTAVTFGHVELVQTLLKEGADPNKECGGSLHWSPIHRAVWNVDKCRSKKNPTVIFEMLLAKGANIFALTDTRETPYMLAKRKRAELGDSEKEQATRETLDRIIVLLKERRGDLKPDSGKCMIQ